MFVLQQILQALLDTRLQQLSVIANAKQDLPYTIIRAVTAVHMYPQKTRMPDLMEEKGKPQLCYEKKWILPEILVSTPDLKSNPTAQRF